MDPAIKKVAIVIALALIVVLGLIFVTQGADSKEAQVATQNIQQTVEATQTQEPQEADAQSKPADEADASEVSKTNEALIEDDAQEEVMYEGALAGLSEEEIAKMALAEEEGTARTETTGIENPID
ncbi:MAG: hypothetical protein IJ313_14525 [Clostridia bacterium]|nr:hypothetical protein [Clostridia bacterium]